MVEPLVALFPGLSTSTFRVTSPADRDYNCIGWAAGSSSKWWWPDPDNDGVFWPDGVALEETLDAFVAAFATLGYSPCEGKEQEVGCEKVALFATADGAPTHAARQLPTCGWTSKLGFLEDIEHELHAVSGTAYGSVVRILKRPVPSP